LHYADKRVHNSRNGNNSIYAIIIDKCGLQSGPNFFIFTLKASSILSKKNWRFLSISFRN